MSRVVYTVNGVERGKMYSKVIGEEWADMVSTAEYEAAKDTG